MSWSSRHRLPVAAVQTQAAALLQAWPRSWVSALYRVLAPYWHGWALAMQSQGEKGLPQIHQGMTTIVATGQNPDAAALSRHTGGGCRAVGAGLRGAMSAGQGSVGLQGPGRGDMVAEAYRLQAEFLLRQAAPDAVQAEASFQQALALARRQQAKSWELRAAVSLRRLWQQQGKQDEAQQLLAPLYSWFTEGFDTTNLQEAKALQGNETIPKQRPR